MLSFRIITLFQWVEVGRIHVLSCDFLLYLLLGRLCALLNPSVCFFEWLYFSVGSRLANSRGDFIINCFCHLVDTLFNDVLVGLLNRKVLDFSEHLFLIGFVNWGRSRQQAMVLIKVILHGGAIVVVFP